MPSLTPRQKQSLSLAACGWTDRQIANELTLSPHTVQGYLRAARRRLAALNTTHAVALAISWGLINFDVEMATQRPG